MNSVFNGGVPTFSQLNLDNQDKEVPIELVEAETDKAAEFCNIMYHPLAPRDFNTQVINTLKGWKLLPDELVIPNIPDDYDEFRKVIYMASEKAKLGSIEFIHAFSRNPWNYNWSIEGEFTEAELLTKLPYAIEIGKQLPDKVKFLFRAQPGERYLKIIVREDGRRQVIRLVNTNRDINEIRKDAKHSPTVIAPFEAIKLSGGKTALLIEWFEGHPPITSEEKALCLSRAEGLIRVPIAEYDLRPDNFIISDQITGQPNVHYIDRDIPTTIAEIGFVSDISEERRLAFAKAKEKVK